MLKFRVFGIACVLLAVPTLSLADEIKPGDKGTIVSSFRPISVARFTPDRSCAALSGNSVEALEVSADQVFAMYIEDSRTGMHSCHKGDAFFVSKKEFQEMTESRRLIMLANRR